ncbi:MAG TPA: WXG100 family type VII secretion target [Jatrophihabitans sp.]|jgi:uncharacterized protein YukE|nr:WXG100 family type VII secretion target [Jatrophihabitans sp.]
MDINVSYQELQGLAGWLEQTHGEMTNTLQQMQGKITELTNSGFRTQLASGAFRDATDQWNNGAKNMLEGMTKMSSFLTRVGQEHVDLDQRLQGEGGTV